VLFILDPDGSVCSCECSVWDQDCLRGYKCSAWANDGGTAWNATRCSPVDPDPDAPGEPCTVEDSPVSGVDSCDVGSMCWNVDPRTLVGVCVPLCQGGRGDPMCPPDRVCRISNEGVLILCLSTCDPLAPECNRGEECTADPETGAFSCMPHADNGTYGQDCTDLATCGPGLLCASATRLPGIGDCARDATACCTYWCDLTAADPEAACPDTALGQSCVPFYEEGEAPEGYEHVGFCGLE
jgi:hypothetical protein